MCVRQKTSLNSQVLVLLNKDISKVNSVLAESFFRKSPKSNSCSTQQKSLTASRFLFNPVCTPPKNSNKNQNLWFTPHPVTVTNEGLFRDSLLKMVHNPGGDWHPGWGVVPTKTILFFSKPLILGFGHVLAFGFSRCFFFSHLSRLHLFHG